MKLHSRYSLVRCDLVATAGENYLILNVRNCWSCLNVSCSNAPYCVFSQNCPYLYHCFTGLETMIAKISVHCLTGLVAMKQEKICPFYINHCITGLVFMSYHLWGVGHIDFGSDPVGIGVGIGMTLSCLHNILWTSGFDSYQKMFTDI